MSYWTILIIAIVSFALSWYSVGKLIEALTRKNIVDVPNERTLHQGSVPRGAGLIPMAALIITTFLLAIFSEQLVFYSTILFYLVVWSLLGWLDDQFDLSASLRLFAQLVLAGMLVYLYGHIDKLVLSHEVVIYLSFFGVIGAVIASVIGIVWLVNLYNFMDGMDGLSASQTIIASITLSIWFYHFDHDGLFYLCLVLASSTYGFLLWNWHPAKVFMGDVGSIGIGAFFALTIVLGVNQYEIPVLSFVILLAVFIYDATYTLIVRILRKEKVWEAHRSHHYQRLAGLGFAHQKIVLGMITLMLTSALIASITVQYHDIVWLGVVFILVILVCCSTALRCIEARRSK